MKIGVFLVSALVDITKVARRPSTCPTDDNGQNTNCNQITLVAFNDVGSSGHYNEVTYVDG
jgi:hypothetical protein